MINDQVEMFAIALNIISLVILTYVLFSRHKHRITVIGFWQNIVLLLTILTISKIAKISGLISFSETVFLIFSALVMLIMLVSFVFHYPYEEGFEFKEKPV